jgi:fatty-acyl-CoA synthase
MTLRFAERSREACEFPFTIGHLLDSATSTAQDQEIVYPDQVFLNCRKLREALPG